MAKKAKKKGKSNDSPLNHLGDLARRIEEWADSMQAHVSGGSVDYYEWGVALRATLKEGGGIDPAIAHLKDTGHGRLAERLDISRGDLHLYVSELAVRHHVGLSDIGIGGSRDDRDPTRPAREAAQVQERGMELAGLLREIDSLASAPEDRQALAETSKAWKLLEPCLSGNQHRVQGLAKLLGVLDNVTYSYRRAKAEWIQGYPDTGADHEPIATPGFDECWKQARALWPMFVDVFYEVHDIAKDISRVISPEISWRAEIELTIFELLEKLRPEMDFLRRYDGELTQRSVMPMEVQENGTEIVIARKGLEACAKKLSRLPDWALLDESGMGAGAAAASASPTIGIPTNLDKLQEKIKAAKKRTGYDYWNMICLVIETGRRLDVPKFRRHCWSMCKIDKNELGKAENRFIEGKYRGFNEQYPEFKNTDVAKAIESIAQEELKLRLSL